MTTPKRFWADLATTEFDALDCERTVAVLPVAATEQHGPHLPLSVDTTLLDGLIQATLPQLPDTASVLFLPTLAIGKSNEHQHFAGTLTLSAETLLRVWMELGASVARAGIRKLLLLNSHGGQSAFLDIVNHDLRNQHGLLVWSVDWFRLGLPGGLFDPDEVRFGIHGGDVETSMMLVLAPQRVDRSKLRDFGSGLRTLADDYPTLATHARLGWRTEELNPTGAVGNAAAASAAKGQAVIDLVSGRLALLLQEFAAMPADWPASPAVAAAPPPPPFKALSP